MQSSKSVGQRAEKGLSALGTGQEEKRNGEKYGKYKI